MSHIDSLGSSGCSGPSGASRRSNSAVTSGSTNRLSAGSDLGRPGAHSGSTTLRGLSDRELLSRVKDLVTREREVTLEVLVHLIEVERRRLHFGLGYPSMFEYAVRHLGYSESGAARRIRAARCIRDYPEVHGLLEKNEVNLVAVSLVSSIFTASNAKELLEKIRGKSQREVEAVVATYRPPVSMRDQAKPVCVAVPVPSAVQTQRTSGSVGVSADSEKRPNTAAAGGAAGPLRATTEAQALPQAASQLPDGQPTPASPALERKFQMQFLASERFMRKFERAKALLSNRSGTLSYEAVLEVALDEFLKDHDPEERNKRREDRRKKGEARTKSEDRQTKKAEGPRENEGNGSAGSGQADDPLFRRWIGGLPASRAPTNDGTSRRVPAPVRDAVFARDKGRCTYVGSNGERCAATHHLQIDHVIPYARGGTNALGNLRLLCERHNKKEAERVYGANVMREFRARE